ncbi:vitamin D-binding protein-like [Rhinatrema bivittatum]|uniref:vitamin D-binding protein-like n=1 Tax=Rhinatrema bivittatum TaxID=194408 RepID=UPI00112B1F9A|nr:vitamin D-binding protein-like [Rhinatrema bivittatum]
MTVDSFEIQDGALHLGNHEYMENQPIFSYNVDTGITAHRLRILDNVTYIACLFCGELQGDTMNMSLRRTAKIQHIAIPYYIQHPLVCHDLDPPVNHFGNWKKHEALSKEIKTGSFFGSDMDSALEIAAPACLTHEPWYLGSTDQEVKNTGCGLTYGVETVFRTRALIFYTQILVNNSFEDVKRLVNGLILFSSNCCLIDAGSDCFEDQSSVFLARACKDAGSKLKNKEAAACCGKLSLERQNCFKELRHSPSGQLPPLGASDHLEERCLFHMGDHRSFVENYLYEFSRRLQIFPPETVAQAVNAFIKMHEICCKELRPHACFLSMTADTVTRVVKVIAEANRICNKYKVMGAGKTILWGIVFFTSFNPTGSIAKTMDFATNYEQCASQCCELSKWATDCFLDESEVLLDQFCSKSTPASYSTCCLRNGSDRIGCLNAIANQQSKAVPEKIPARAGQLCKIHREDDANIIVWYTYEYARRHRKQNLDMVLRAVSDFKTTVKRCCKESDYQICLSTSLPQLSFPVP